MKKKLFVFLIIALVLLCFASCAAEQKTIGEEICDSYLPAVVEIKVTDDEDNAIGYATGTIIDEEGLILTNRHVVRGYNFQEKEYFQYENFYVRFYNENEYTKVSLESFSEELDLALLNLNRATHDYFKMGRSEDLRYGEQIHTIGNGNNYGLAYSSGSIAAPLRNIIYEEVSIEAIQLSLNISEGNSGGPLINNKGELVGLTTFRLRDNSGNVTYGTCFALTTNSILSFLNVSKKTV